jgi:hypothetical protein
MLSLYAVEMKVTGTFSSYVEAESREEAEQITRDRARQMNPDSVVFETSAYQMEPCELCGEEHFGPACMKRASELIRPSWERARL